MKKLFASMLMTFVAIGTAEADLPKWCGKNDFTNASKYELDDLKRSDPKSVVQAIARLRCSSTPDVAAVHADIDKARAAWGKKLGMNEDDWADAVEFIDDHQGAYPAADLSTKDMAQFTPMDQWQAIRYGLGKDAATVKGMYIADALDARLTEVGRLAWLDQCLPGKLDHDGMGDAAVCDADVEAWSFDKLATQLRSDTVHTGGTKMHLRFLALEMNDRIADYKKARAGMVKTDEEYQKLFQTAAKGREDWKKTVGADTKALDVLLAMDSATFAGSRKMFEGCDAKTQPLLEAAVSTVPAKTFTGIADDRMDPFHGFAYKAGAPLVGFPQVWIAANAWAQCHEDKPAAKWLFSALYQAPTQRGPRAAAVNALRNEKFTFDDKNAGDLRYPDTRDSTPYARRGKGLQSSGGVVDSITTKGDIVSIKLQKTTAQQSQCTKSHFGKRVSRIRDDGSLEYELICDKREIVTVDTTWSGDFKVAKSWAPLLKKGVVFTSYEISGLDAGDVLAIWPTKTATEPSMILGIKLKAK